MRGQIAYLLLAAAALSVGCAESDGAQTMRISVSDVPKGEWPLIVSEGVVRCEGRAVIFQTPDGRDYGVNGTALSLGHPKIDPIWRIDPDGDARVNISPVLNRGLKLCKRVNTTG